MLLDCMLESLRLLRDFVSKGFEQTLINLTAIEIFENLLLQLNKLIKLLQLNKLNKLSNFSCNIDYMELCPATLHMGH